MSNYIPKNLDFGDEGRKKLTQGITKISQAVKSTLGPRGRTVLIESEKHLGGLIITKDGVTVANDFFLDDPVENLSAQMMKEAARKTANTAGDGTTTAIVLTEAIVNAGNLMITPNNNVSEVVKYINKYSEIVVDHLTLASKKVTKDMLNDVATISANNDKDLGKIISDAYNKVGKNGIVTIERSQNHETYATVTNGIKVDRGYTSNLFVTDNKNDESVLEDVYILVCDQEISNLMQLEGLLKRVVSENKKLLIIGPCSTNVVQTLAANVMRNGLKLYFSEKTGDDLSLISFEDLGHADKIIAGTTQTVIIKNNQMTEEINTRISDLKEQQSNSDIASDRDFINERIASLSGSIGSVFVGANTDIEQKEKYDRVEDAVCAVRSALEEGIVKGGGVALMNCSSFLMKDSYDNDAVEVFDDKYVALMILTQACLEPVKQILQNAGREFEDIYPSYNLDVVSDYDVKNECFGDMYEMGIIDPLKVTKNAFTNAVSVATTILTTNAIITHARARQ